MEAQTLIKMPPHNLEEPEAGKTHEIEILGPSTPVRIGAVVMIAAAVWWGATLTGDVSTIKIALIKLNALETVQGEIKGLVQRLDILERRGSDPMQALQKSLDKVSEDLRMHEALDDKRMKAIQ